MPHALAKWKQHEKGTVISVLHHISGMLHKGSRLCLVRRPRESRSFVEKNRLFSEAGRAVISCMLHGRMKIHPNDVQLDASATDSGAILISERVSNNSEFQKMWAETPCLDILKTLAQRVLH